MKLEQVARVLDHCRMAYSSVRPLRAAGAALASVITVVLMLIGSSHGGFAAPADRARRIEIGECEPQRAGRILRGDRVDARHVIDITTRLTGIAAKSATGETLTAAAVDSVNTFDAPKTVTPKPVSAKVQGEVLSVSLEPKSVTVLAVRQ